ncbi:iron ABC transporter permease [Saccharomonospora sp. NPDC046836]|uniref:ABC transporter permease n=1 Tax=Saccharomonospora sp. NPDC046836 TaxID=3156921 RepID=UPI0033EF27DA
MTTTHPNKPPTGQAVAGTGQTDRSGRRGGDRLRTVVYVLTGLVVLYLVGAPLLFLMWGTFFDADGVTLDSFRRAFGSAEAAEMVGNSLMFAFGAGVVSLVTGTTLAYLYARTDVPFKSVFFAASLVPLILPPVVYAPAWVFLFSEDVGAISGPLTQIFGASPVNAYGMTGMIAVEGLHLAPIVFLFMVAAFRSMDPSLEEAGKVCGARWSAVARRITLPLVKPALASATVIVIVLGLESFEVPVMLGEPAGLYVFTSRIYFLTNDFPADLGAAGALSVALMAVAALLLAVTGGGRSGREHQTVTGKAFRPAPVSLGRARVWVGSVVAFYFVVAVIAPVLVLIYVALSPYYQAPSIEAFSALGFSNFEKLAELPGLGSALVNTVLLAVVSATLVMLVTVVASSFVVRTRLPGRRILDWIALAPLMVPGVVLGLGLSFVYLRFPFPVYGTVILLAIAYVTRFIPYGMRYAGASMAQVSNELEEAARIGGARWATTMRRVLLPLTAPGVLSGWIFVLMITFRELSSTVLLAGPDSEVLSVILFRQYNEGTFGIVAALGVLMAVALLTIILLANRLGSRFGIRVEA